ncbi:DsbA family protein [Kaistia dalseonensis]|uniref:Protein-disulfide isomerase n=1 Tax=Kaistia dalseonensis TaxID=410840 RepID=A0ABU0HCS0_9HYPH|nr:DsbA family protein [Kaistia dalseonensis]MCX5497480.1 DsbA family protein [Kaistia dalseonensis]MDQ0440119.1 protein-disulfide isomerase [Kaistia dalseonensis]
MQFNRRQFLGRAGATSLAVGALTMLPRGASAETKVDMAELLKPGPLGDQILGKDDAPNVIVEYASLTCTHCKHFHDTTWKPLKEQYIDTGKVKFILRDFPLDPLATAGFMLAHAAPNNSFYPMVDLLFDTQEKWAFVDDPVTALLGIAKQVGFTQETFELTLKNQALLDGVNAVKDRGAKEFGVDATPTFFINGVKAPGALSLEEVQKLLV